ncbi:MAG: tetratricopeptide repeat protein, partial [Elusimicrobia bacterium]|nr:tetratricopeptide repeat protein [Elusimicrobiota bacterium]
MRPRTTDADPFVAAQRRLDARRWLEARTLLTPLAEAGDAKAQAALSLLDERGLGGPRDLAVSLRWCAAAATQGHREATRRLGLKYRFGHGTTVDLDRAEEWFRKGSEQDDLDALCELADLQRTRADGK